MSVLVFAENWNGKFKKSTFEVVSYACETAKTTRKTVTAVVIGNVTEDDLKQLGNYGASKILFVGDNRLSGFVNQAYASVIAQAVKDENADVVVLSNTYSGKALAPRLAVKLQAGLAAEVTQLPVVTAEKFTVRKKVYCGKAFAEMNISSQVKILTLAVNSFQVIKTENNAVITAYSPVIPETDFRTITKEVVKTSGKVSVTEAEIVVSGGRGLKGPENWGLVENLAELLGAATACTKPVADVGWRPHHEHVGQTGKAISPNLYVAIGISGAIQHLAGVNSSKVIVVINKDAEAPFLKAADYAIVGDAFEVVPKLINAVKAYHSSHH